MLKKIWQDGFLRNNLVFFSGSMVVALLNYLYHPVLGRLMSVEDFGEVQTLISIFTQLAIVVGIFSVTTVNITSNQEDKTERDRIISDLRNISLYITGGIFCLIIIFSRQLENFFNFQSFYPFISLAVLLLVGALLAFRNAFLQGLQRFKSVSAASIINAGAKLFFGFLLVFLGGRSFGAISALIIAQVLTLAYLFYKTKDDLTLRFNHRINLSPRVRAELKYGFLVFFATSCITFLYTADVLAVKHYFDPESAGLYSGIATIARIIIFLAGPTAAVLLPAVKLKNEPIQNKKLLWKALLFAGLIGSVALLTFSLFHDLIIRLMIGSRYLPLAPLLPKLSLLLFVISILNVIFYYFLAMRDYFLVPASVLGIMGALLANYFNHGSLSAIIDNFLYSSILIAVLLLLYYAKNNFRHRPVV